MSTPASGSYADHTFRRIITSHSTADTDGSDVVLHDDIIPLKPVLDAQAYLSPLFASNGGVPAVSAHSISASDIDGATALAPGVVTPNGVNGQVTDVKPGFKIQYHRTNSIDYNVFLSGSAWLITPIDNGKGEKRTLVRAGEVVVQRGTIHAWEAGPEGARWCTVVVAAKPVVAGGKELEEVDF